MNPEDAQVADAPISAGDLKEIMRRNPRLRGYAKVDQQQSLVKPRITVQEVVYWQEPGGQPVNFDGSYSAQLESTDQPCPPRITVGESWQPLDKLWFDSCSLLCLRNEEGRFQVRPTPEQLGEMIAKVVEIGVSDGGESILRFALLRPGRTMRLEPENLADYRLRCQSGRAKLAVMAFPA